MGTGLATKIIHYATLIVVAFIIAGVLSMLVSAFAEHCDFPFGCPLDLQPQKSNQYPQGRLLEIGRQNIEFYKDVVSVVWIQKGDQWIIANLHLIPIREDLICPMDSAGYRASGCYRHSDESIWILKGWEGKPTKLGCSILWHEILHGQGLDHGKMKQKHDNWVCAINQ